jgi:hypothetical protein
VSREEGRAVQQHPVVIAVPACLSAADVQALGVHVEALFRRGLSVVCELEASDLGVVDALARMHLLARRTGGALEVRGLVPLELLGLTGLSEVCGQPEPREQVVDVEEVVDVGDPSV